MVERLRLAAGFLYTVIRHVDHLIVETFVDLATEAKLLSDRLEHGLVRFTASLLAVPTFLSDFTEPMLSLVDSLLGDVDLIDGLGRGVVNVGADGGLADAQAVLVDELDEEAALLVGNWRILLCHLIKGLWFSFCFLIVVIFIVCSNHNQNF